MFWVTFRTSKKYLWMTVTFAVYIVCILLHPFNGLFSRTTWLSRYWKRKTSLGVREARDDGVLECSGISWTICKQSAPHFRQITTPAPHHSVFTGWMLFLTPNQRCQSTEGSVVCVQWWWIELFSDVAGTSVVRQSRRYIRADVRCDKLAMVFSQRKFWPHSWMSTWRGKICLSTENRGSAGIETWSHRYRRSAGWPLENNFNVWWAQVLHTEI